MKLNVRTDQDQATLTDLRVDLLGTIPKRKSKA